MTMKSVYGQGATLPQLYKKNVDDNGEIGYNQVVDIAHNYDEPVDLYLHIDNVLPTLTAPTYLDDVSIEVDDITGISAGDVITIYEGINIYQSLVRSASGTTVILYSPMDKAFTTDAEVHIGDWNLSVDGTVTPVVATLSDDVDILVSDDTLNVVSVTGINEGDIVTIQEGTERYQALITDITSLVITLDTKITFDFTTDANIIVRKPATIAYIKAPLNAKMNIHSVRLSMTDGVVMDSAKFGGITALTNGIIFRTKDGTTKNLAIIVNNMGFAEFGFTNEYDAKAPAGVYGFRASRIIEEVNGVTILLDGATADEFQIIIRDDLTALTNINVQVSGHLLTD